MLSINVTLDGFDGFIEHLGNLTDGGIFEGGFRQYAERAREIAIQGTPVGDDRDEHPGLMKKSWEQPKYHISGNYHTATITNTVDYGMAENYGHFQEVGRYVPAIDAQLVHFWVPGTYALETSMDEAELEWSSIIGPEILRRWNNPVDDPSKYINTVRQTFYDDPGGELDE